MMPPTNYCKIEVTTKTCFIAYNKINAVKIDVKCLHSYNSQCIDDKQLYNIVIGLAPATVLQEYYHKIDVWSVFSVKLQF
jgi:hypothetical protein